MRFLSRLAVLLAFISLSALPVYAVESTGAAAPLADPPYRKCEADVNYAPGTQFVACCSLTSLPDSCTDCCSIDAAHAANCPVSTTVKASCNKTAVTKAAPPIKVIPLTNALNTPYIQVVIGRFAGVLIGLSGSLALLIFVWAGITMITSDGDAAKVQKAKNMMLWTAIGLLIIFVSAPAVRFILNALTGSVS